MSEKIELVSDAKFIHQEGVMSQKIVLFGSETRNSYIKMRESTYIYAKEIVSLLQEHKTQHEITEEMSVLYPRQNIDVSAFIKKLRSAGLLEGIEKTFDDEMELLGITVLNKRFHGGHGKSTAIKFLYKFFSLAYIWCPVIALCCFLFTVFQNQKVILADGGMNLFWGEFVLTLFLVGLCFLFHEIGHAVAAIYNDVEIKEFSFGLYLGFIPMFYFRYNNMKVAVPKVKLRIVIAGVYVNAVMAMICFALVFVLSESEPVALCLYKFSKLNALMVIGNLLPTRLSDGYYIISLLFNKYDIRLSFWKNLLGSREDKKKVSLPLLLYFCIMVSSLVYTVASFAAKIYAYIKSGNYVYGYGYLMIVCLMVIGIIYNVSIKLHGAKNMSFNLMKNKMKIRMYKKHCLSNFVISMLFVTVVVTGSIVFWNARNHSLSKYWEDNGQADVIAVYSSDTTAVMNEVYNMADSVSYADITETACSDSDGIHEITAVMAETNVYELIQKFNIGIKNIQSGGVWVNSKVTEWLNCEIGDSITIDNREYTVSGVTDAVNFISPKEAIIIHDSSSDGATGCVIGFIDFCHDSKAIKVVTELLKDNNISFLNQYEVSEAIAEEFSELNQILYLLLLAVFVICFVLVLTSFSLTLKNESGYWINMRMLGISKKKMKRIILLENALFSFGGSIVGAILAFFTAKAICALTGTMFDFRNINKTGIFCIVISGIAVVMLPIFIVLRKQIGNEIMNPFAGRQVNKRPKRKGIVVYFVMAVLFAVIAITIDMWLKNFVSSGAVCYVIKLVLLFIALMLFVVVIIDGVSVVSKKMNGKSIQLTRYLIKNHSTRIKGITVSLVVCMTMLAGLMDFSGSYKRWAEELGMQQLIFDARMTATNDGIGLKQIEMLNESDKAESKACYRIDAGRLSNLPVYVMTESSGNGGLNEIYNCPVEFNRLDKEEIVVTKRLMNDLKLQHGDKVKITLDGEAREVTIVDSFDTQDYSSYIVIVSDMLFDGGAYDKVCVDFKLSEGIVLDEIRNMLDSSVKIESRNDLILQWQETIVSGVDLLIWICGIMAIALLIMLSNSIKNSIFDRKQELSLLRTLGLGKKEMLHLLFTEMALLHLPSLMFAVLVAPIISKTFVDLSSEMSGYEVIYHCNGLMYFLILVLIAVILFLSPIKHFNKVKNESPIDGLKCT